MTRRNSLLCAIGASATVPALFWAYGYNFDHRGDAAVSCLFISIFAFWFAYFVARDPLK